MANTNKAYMSSCEPLELEGVDCRPDRPGRSSDEGNDEVTTEVPLSSAPNTASFVIN